MKKILNLFSKKETQPVIVELFENNFVLVRLWKPKINGTVTSYIRAAFGEKNRKNAVVGHISIEIFSKDKKAVYLSHWPDFQARSERLQNSQNTSDSRSRDNRDVGKNNTLQFDLEQEGLPDDYFILYGLDVVAILKEVSELGETCHWTLKGRKSDKNGTKEPSFSCSSYVYELLKSGRLFSRLLSESDQLHDPISPIDVGNILNKAREIESKLYPHTKSYLKNLKKVKERILANSNSSLEVSTVDYAACYNKYNPNDRDLLNIVGSNLANFYNQALLDKVKENSCSSNKTTQQNLSNEIIKLIDKCGANPLVQDENGHNALYYAVINRNYNCLKTILNKYPELAGSTIETKLTHRNVKGNKDQSSDLLLFPMPKNSTSLSPTKTLIDLAADLGYDEITTLLIKFGANPTSSMKIG